jgi:hypothetical protein
MDTFDNISCEEYNQAWGTDEEQFHEWVLAVEEVMLEGVNADLREISAK